MKGFRDDRLRDLSRLYPIWEKKTIWQYFEATANRFSQNSFIVAQGRDCYSYSQTREMVIRAAKGFLALGVKPGEHVAIQVENSPEQIFAALAVNAIGAVKIPVNTGLSARELEFVLRQSDARYLVTDCKLVLDGRTTGLKMAVALLGAECQLELPVISWEMFLTMGEGGRLPDIDDEKRADEVCDIIYTSGSTKAPKGVMLTHDMLMRSAYASCVSRGFELGRRIFVPLPLFHVYGYVEGMLAAILVGGAVILRKGKFRAEPVLSFMKESRANDVLSVPSQMMALIQALEEQPEEFPDLHSVYCSASICPSWVWPGIRKAFGVSDVITGYGMTEVCGASMQTAPEDGDETLMSRVGRILPAGISGLEVLSGHQIEYRVVDPNTGSECGAEENGELWCRGLTVMRGYYHRPEANQRVFTEDGWFKTGDSGHFDKNGYLIMAGRIDDMYKINGENVSPKFLEDVLGSCPEIHEVEIVGVPDDKHGYIGIAFVELHEDTEENRIRAEQYSKDHLAKYQIPRYFVYMREEDWPRTSTGKVQKFHLKEMAAAKKAELETTEK